MANQKISELALGNPALSSDELPVNRSGANFSITAGSIAALTAPGGTPGDIQYNNAGVLGGVTKVPLVNGGTNADLSASGSSTAILAQDASHVISARALIAGDIPNLAASKITSGQLALANGGTNVDLSAAGGATAILAQDASHVISARSLIAADIPSLPASIITSGQVALTRGGTNADLSLSGSSTAILAQDASHVISARALIAGDIPNLAASKITSGQLALANGGTNADLSGTGGSNQFLKQSSVGAAVTVGAISAADIPSGAVIWSAIGNASADLTLSQGTNNTTFNQTSAVTWKWANTTAATSGVSQSSPIVKIAGRYWSGADAEDNWTLQNVIANGTNGTSTLTFTHTGTSGAAIVNIPAGISGTPSLQFGGTSTGLWGAASFLRLDCGSTSGGFTLLGGSTQLGAINFGSSLMAILSSVANRQFQINGGITSTAIMSSLINNGGGNFTSTTNGGTAGVLDVAGTFAPTSGSCNFIAHRVNPTINQTSTSSGNYTGLLVNVVETSLKGSANLLLDLQAGATGGTSEFAVNNSGVITKYKATTTVGAGVPSLVATVDSTGLTAAVSTVTLYAVPAAGAGLYRISFYSKVTTAGGVSSVLGGTNGFQLTWTDPTDSTTPTATVADTLGGALNGNVTTTADAGSVVVAAKASTNIQYAYDYTSSGSAMAYKLSIKVEFLG